MNKPLILWGGTDINPELYFEQALPTTDKPDNERDRHECMEVALAIDTGRPIVGICRGAQLLCALNGGKLDQHVPIHRNNNHTVMCFVGRDFDKVHNFVPISNVAADHHQVMLPAGKHLVLGFYEDGVAEVVWWPETKCLAVQPHPEWMSAKHDFNLWLNDLMKSLDIEHEF